MSPAAAVVTAGTLADQVAYTLERAILDGELEPGSELRQEELCATLGISRTPVREALRRLQALGLVVLGANRTARVRRMARADVVDLYEVRARLEGWAAERAAERMTRRQLGALEDAQRDLERAAETLGSARRGDVRDQAALHELLREPNDRFHALIHQASDSALLGELVVQTWGRFPKDYAWRALSREDEAVSLNTEQHRRIIAALARRDPPAAREAMHDHVHRSGELLISYLDRQAFWGPAGASVTQEETRHA